MNSRTPRRPPSALSALAAGWLRTGARFGFIALDSIRYALGYGAPERWRDRFADLSNLIGQAAGQRLGIDMARLALDAAAPIDFSPPHWARVSVLAAGRVLASLPDSSAASFAGLDAVQHGRTAYIVAHPLWDHRPASLHPALAAAQAAAAASGLSADFRSSFMMIRRPV